MAVRLDDSSSLQETRLQRWLRGLTPETALRLVPVVTLLGLPLAVMVARLYHLGYAAHFGIPSEFVETRPVDAFIPFFYIAFLSAIGFISWYQAQRFGWLRVLKNLGHAARFLWMAWVFVYVTIEFFQGQMDPLVAGGVILISASLLWGIPSLLGSAGRPVLTWARGELASVENQRRLSRLATMFPREVRRMLLGVVAAYLVLITPRLLGAMDASIEEEFPVIESQGSTKLGVVLAVYGDKAFIGEIDGLHDDTFSAILMRSVTELEDKEIKIVHIEELDRE
jgi:hypothetical protein